MLKYIILALIALLSPIILPNVSAEEGTWRDDKTLVELLYVSENLSTLTIKNRSALPRRVYARFEYAIDPGNRNYGFIQTIPPFGEIRYEAPAGTDIWACDGKYWEGFTPKEKLMVTADGVSDYVYTVSEFKP
ncbi:MAG: hypothetical protein AAGG45_00570 [Pseudomonadota bacterium]